jgi:hypothetical protein
MKSHTSLLTIALITLFSCKSYPVTLGMSEADFLQHNKVKLVEAKDHLTIYKKQQDAATHFNPETKFYYFRDGKLVEINEGQRTPDIIVEKRER